MADSFKPYQGGISPVQGVSEAGARIGSMTQEGLMSFGQSLAEGIQAYHKNSAENDYLTESLSLKATELSKWANVVGQDPKYAPLLEGFLPMMEKAGKGPSMSLTQKRALDSQLGAFLKAVPDDLRTVETIAANKEKQANEDAEASAVLETFGTMIPSLDIQPQRKPFAEQAKRIANEIANATSPQARRAATLKGTMFLKNIGGAMQVQDAEYASRAQAIAGSPEAVSAANYATPTGVSEKGVEGISLVNEQGMPLSPNEALEKFRQKVEELKKANPAYEINPDAETKFLESMGQGIMNSQAPDAVKQDWSNAVNATLLARAVGESSLGKKIGKALPSLKAAGKEFEKAAGAAKPKGALVKEQQPELPESVKAEVESVATLKKNFAETKRLSVIPHLRAKGTLTTAKEDAERLKTLKGNLSKNFIPNLILEYKLENPNANDGQVAKAVATWLNDEGLLTADGTKLAAGIDGQVSYDELIARARIWADENLPADEVKDFMKEAVGKDEMSAGEVWGGIGTATTVLGVGGWQAKRQLNKLDAYIAKETKFLNDARLAELKDIETQTIEAAKSAGGTAPKRVSQEAALRKENIEAALKTEEGRAILIKRGLVSRSKNKPISYDALHNPIIAKRLRVSEKAIVEAKKELEDLGKNLRSGTFKKAQAVKKAVVYQGVPIAAQAGGTYALTYLDTQTPDSLKDYKVLFGKGGQYKELDAALKLESTRVEEREKEVGLLVQEATKGQTPKKIPAPTTAAINVASAQMFKAASRQEQIDRTADFINRTLGFQYSNAREIAMKFNPPESQAQVVNLGGREFLAQTDPKTGKIDYKELSAKEDPNANYFGEIVAQEVKNPDGSIGYAAGLKPRNMSMMIVGGKYPAWFTPNHKQEFSQKVENANNTLYTIKELKTELQQPTIRLTNRQAAAKVRSLATLVEFYRVKSIGTPPISDTELNKIADSLMTKDANSPVQFDDNFISALTTTEMMVKAEMKSTINTMGWSGNQVIYVDDAKGSNKTDPVVVEASKSKAETRGIVPK